MHSERADKHKPRYKRILLKLSGEALMGDSKYGISPKTLASIAQDVKDVVLLDQVHVNTDKYDGKTIDEIRTELAGQTGENVVIRRFARFAVGA